MAAHYKALQAMALKLGVGEEKCVLEKAAEFDRLLQIKLPIGNNMTDTCKQVVCLHLAAAMYNAQLDLNIAVKYSGLKRQAYLKSKKGAENLLEINSGRLTISILCVSLDLDCIGLESLAQQILDEYKRQSKIKIDMNLPQYICIAVYQACRVRKIKVAKRKLMQKSFLKPAQWAKLDAMFTKVVDEFFITKRQFVKRSKKTEHVQTQVTQQERDTTEQSYSDWEQKVLKSAYKFIKQQKSQQKKKQD